MFRNFWELKRHRKLKLIYLLGGIVVLYTTLSIWGWNYFHNDKINDTREVKQSIHNTTEICDMPQELKDSATEVTVGSIVDNIYDFSVNNSTYSAEITAWFKWDGNPGLDPHNNFKIVNGSFSGSKQIMKEDHYFIYTFEDGSQWYMTYKAGEEEDVYKAFIADGGTIDPNYEGDEQAFITDYTVNYARIKFNTKISKAFDVTRAGLASYTLDIRFEDGRDTTAIRYVKDDSEGTGSFNDKIRISGYNIVGTETNIAVRNSQSVFSDTDLKENGSKIDFSQYITSIDIQQGLDSYLNICLQVFLLFVMAVFSLFNDAVGRLRYAFVGSTLFGVISANRSLMSMIPSGTGEINLLSVVSLSALASILIITLVLNITENIQMKYQKSLDRNEAYYARECVDAKVFDNFCGIAITLGYFIFNIIIIIASLT